MKIAIPTSDKVNINDHFGRADYFAIYDDSGVEPVYYYDNRENANSAQGAGIQAATGVVNEKVEVVLSPSLGPKATDVLKSAGVKSYLIVEKGIPLIEVLKSYKDGKLKSIY